LLDAVTTAGKESTADSVPVRLAEPAVLAA
jgi:hypothetical protein